LFERSSSVPVESFSFFPLHLRGSVFDVRCRALLLFARQQVDRPGVAVNTYLLVGGYASSLLVEDFQDKITVHWRGRLELVARRGEGSSAVMELSSRAAAGMYDAACFTNTR
jgi:hypothetical protein